jgi:hypothetical protein
VPTLLGCLADLREWVFSCLEKLPISQRSGLAKEASSPEYMRIKSLFLMGQSLLHGRGQTGRSRWALGHRASILKRSPVSRERISVQVDVVWRT